ASPPACSPWCSRWPAGRGRGTPPTCGTWPPPGRRSEVNWVDLLVIGLAILAAVSGARQGVIIALPAFLGVLLGLIAGVLIAPLVVEHIDATPTRVAFAFAIFVLFIALGETLGVWVGRTIRQKINSPKLSGVDSV